MKRSTHRVIADEYLLHNRCDLDAFAARDTLRDTLSTSGQLNCRCSVAVPV